ncbi:hypothetical protein DEI92_01110 [Curtobacterium sp. MCBD17_034]|uniref:hypothetical protein n=1 Tax=unclassified Curtobacterium TaxID=257496 RepID=UPI000DA9E2C2|nr:MULTISPECIES: hypothetical protein [unclassified Curtobacterium]PZF62139.1 hypothetical protein DEI92_01110 [Curtobacterium sp. MCBD17_034]PZM33926.1 hypothetical protein DEI90_09590 [Curtobacterium sp. MCBD17_031]
MNVTSARVSALVGPLRVIKMDQPDKQQETRARLRALARDVRDTGRPSLIRWVDEAERSVDGQADVPLSELARILYQEEQNAAS